MKYLAWEEIADFQAYRAPFNCALDIINVYQNPN